MHKYLPYILEMECPFVSQILQAVGQSKRKEQHMPAALGLRVGTTVQAALGDIFRERERGLKFIPYFSRRLVKEGINFHSFSIYFAANMALLRTRYKQCFSHLALPQQFG